MDLAKMAGLIYRRGYHETDLSTQQSEAQPEIRLPGADEDAGREDDSKTAQGQGPDEVVGF